MDKSQLVKVPIKYGITGGVLCLLMFLTLHLSGQYPLEMTSYFMSGVIILLMLFFSTKELRDYKYGGFLQYWQGISAGFVCVVLIALVSGLFIYTYASSINSDFLTDHSQYVKEALLEDPEGWIDRHGEEVYQGMLQESEQLISPVDLALDDFLKKFLIGFFLTTIIAIFFKRT